MDRWSVRWRQSGKGVGRVSEQSVDTGRIVASCNREGVDQCRAAVSFGHQGVHSPVLTPPNRHSSDTSVSLHLRPLSACACPSFLDSPAYDYCSYGCSRARLETRFDLGSGTRISSLPRVMTFSRLSWKKAVHEYPLKLTDKDVAWTATGAVTLISAAASIAAAHHSLGPHFAPAFAPGPPCAYCRNPFLYTA